MIPKKAIKKIKNDAHKEIAVGSLISYGVFPQTQEGIEKAKQLIAGKDEWLAPSDLPNYYDDIDTDLLTGRETAGIIYIRNTLKEFYGIDVEKKSAGTETAVDTRVDNIVEENVEVEEENNPDEKEVETQAEAATEFITEAENTVEQQIDESILDDLPASLQASLAKVISKKTGVQLQVGEKKPSSSVTNAKIFRFLTTNLIKIQGQLDGIDKSIQDQTKLVQANLEVTASIYDSLDAQNSILSEKLGAILEAFNKQNELARKLAEDEENRLAEARLEGQRDVAGTESAISTLGKGKGGSGGNTLLRRLTRFFGRRLASRIFRALPFGMKRRAARLRQLKRLPKKLKDKAARKLLEKFAPKIASRVAGKATQAVANKAIGRGVVKGFEHIALPGITKAAQTADKPVAKALEKGGDNILQRALKSPVIQKALLRVLGKEGAEKLTVKLAAKLIPGVSTAYGLGEGLARIAMGDVKGGFLSFGSAIPIAGYGFAAIDILRDINIDAYTKHIEANGPIPSNANIAAFFAEALGVTPDQYEMGGYNKTPGTKLLHGDEAILKGVSGNSAGADPSNIVGGSLVAVAMRYPGMLGSSGASIAPTIRQAAAPLAEQFDVPNTIVHTPVGGSFPSLQSTMKKVREKRKQTPEEELSGMEKDLLEAQDPDSFAEKLLKMLDPEGKFQELLKQINQPRPTGDGPNLTEGGYATFGATGRGSNAKGWVHGHFQNPNSKEELLRDTFPLVKKLLEQGSEVVITGGADRPLNKDMDDSTIKDIISKGIDTHSNRTSGYFAVDVSVREGTKVPFALEDVKDVGGYEGVRGIIPGTNTFIGHLTSDSRSGGPAPSTPRPGTRPLPTAQGLGRQGTAGNKDFGSVSGVGSKGYLIIPGHAAGAGAPEEKQFVKKLAKNAYDNIKKKYPDIKVQYMDVDSMFGDDDAGWEKQKKWYKQKEKEGWEILEVHMDASMESGQGTGRGVIVPVNERNAAEVYFGKTFGGFPEGHGDLAASKRDVGIFELGNMSAELQQASKQNKVTKQQLDALSAPLERAVGSTSNITPPTQRQPAQSKFYTRQGGDNKSNTQILMIPAPSNAGKAIQKNATIEGVRFSYNRDYNTFDTTSEVSSTTRALLLQRLGIN